MARFGLFETWADGTLAGSIKFLAGPCHAKFVPQESTATGRGPAFRIYSGPAEIGAAWRQDARDSGRPYLSVKIDSPELAAPVNGALFEDEQKPGTWHFVWDRQRPQQTRDPGQEG